MNALEKTVLVFVVDNRKILLSRRLNTWFGNNQFAPPGGIVDEGETPTVAATRELLEEANIIVNDADLQLFFQDRTEANDRNFENYYFVTHSWSGELNNNEPHRHSELDWYPLKNLPADTMPLVLELLSKL